MSKKKPIATYDMKEHYPSILRAFLENEKRSTTMIVVGGEMGMGMTYHALRLGEILEKEMRTKEGNMKVETTRKSKSS